MKFNLNTLTVFSLKLSLLLFTINTNAQDTDAITNNDSVQSPIVINKGFHLGLYVGAFWANRSTAYLYDGYGFDQNGQRNSFANSILYNQIVNVYGAGNGGTDLIAQLLNVNHDDWHFTEQDMPINLKYTTTYLVGLNTRYQIDKKASITLNINATKLIVNGKFTINSTSSNNGLPSQAKINQFTITGAEQRLMFQLGYQRIIGKNEKLNLLVEGGLNIILSKVQKNQAFLNSSQVNGQTGGSQNNINIDLMSVYNQPPNNYYSAKYFVGVGIGAFAGLGVNLTINPKYTIQLLYNPSYDRISLGYNPNFKLQHGFGLRIYYNMS